MSFLGDALARGVLPGIAIAFVLGVSTTVGAFVAALAMVGGINAISSHSPLPEDTSIGILFVGFLALAVVIMSCQSGSYSGDLNRFLFGSITAVDRGDLVRQGLAAASAVFAVALFYRAFLAGTFDETLAQLLGLRPRLANAALLMPLAVAIVASFEAVGNLLVFAFLVAPPAAACVFARRVPVIVVAATMALTSVVLFIGVLVVRSLVDASARFRPAHTETREVAR